jgi:hypothetical protein
MQTTLLYDDLASGRPVEVTAPGFSLTDDETLLRYDQTADWDGWDVFATREGLNVWLLTESETRIIPQSFTVSGVTGSTHPDRLTVRGERQDGSYGERDSMPVATFGVSGEELLVINGGDHFFYRAGDWVDAHERFRYDRVTIAARSQFHFGERVPVTVVPGIRSRLSPLAERLL